MAEFVITSDNINGKNEYHQMNVWLTDLRMIDNAGNIINVNAGSDSAQVEYEEITGIDELRITNTTQPCKGRSIDYRK